MTKLDQLLTKSNFTKKELIYLLSLKDELSTKKIQEKAQAIKTECVGNKVYLRGLLEFSNRCQKNCYYCGIRADNSKAMRYSLNLDEMREPILHAWHNGFASLVFQSGERTDKAFVDEVCDLLKFAKKITNNEMGITLSCGEQSKESYQKWFDAGAHRYLLRIESSNKELFYKIHPKDKNHNFENRLKALENLKKTGFQTGTGVMIGLPYQKIEDLADDLLFFRKMDIDMLGMGPYIEHQETPLAKSEQSLLSLEQRFDLSLRMIALMRIMMKDINIASSTALQAIDDEGRIKGLEAGANIIMPNLTPSKYIENYFLYDNKPFLKENQSENFRYLENSIHKIGNHIAYNSWGDSKHYKRRIAYFSR
jgi:biotin synthase